MHVHRIREIQLPLFAFFSSLIYTVYVSAPVTACAFDFCKSYHREWVKHNLFEATVDSTVGNYSRLHCFFFSMIEHVAEHFERFPT